MAQANQREEATRVWEKAGHLIGIISEDNVQMKNSGSTFEEVQVLTELGKTLIHVSKWEEALHVWQVAERFLSSIPEAMEKAWALGIFVKALVEAGKWEEAKRVTNRWEDASAHVIFIKALTEANKWEKAERVSYSIPESWEYSPAHGLLIKTLMEASKWEKAEQVSFSIPEPWEDASAHGIFIKALTEAGKREEAEQFISTITDPWRKALALTRLVKVLTEADKWEEAESAWQRVEQTISTLAKTSQKDSMPRMLAMEEIGQWGEMAKRVGSTPVRPPIFDLVQEDLEVKELAEALTEAGKWEEAEQFYLYHH